MNKPTHWLTPILRQKPYAIAHIRGSIEYPDIQGLVQFFQTRRGVLVLADITGLPSPPDTCRAPVFGFHIHAGGRCSGDTEDPFADAGMHYNPAGCPHPHHAGDLPPLFGCMGRAFLAVMTDRFHAGEILGKTVIIHGSPDDFTTQPAGNAGVKIACGEITALQ